MGALLGAVPGLRLDPLVIETNIVLVDVSGCGVTSEELLPPLQAAGVLKPVLQLGLPDVFIEHGEPARLLALQGLDAARLQAEQLSYPLRDKLEQARLQE